VTAGGGLGSSSAVPSLPFALGSGGLSRADLQRPVAGTVVSLSVLLVAAAEDFA